MYLLSTKLCTAPGPFGRFYKVRLRPRVGDADKPHIKQYKFFGLKVKVITTKSWLGRKNPT